MRSRSSRAEPEPSRVIDPLVGWMMSRIIRSVVVFPAPLGPRNPKMHPDGTVSEMP